MATYVNDLRLKEIATGDEAGTWGASTNTNLELIAEAFSFGTEAITTNADTHTTTIADGSTDPGRSLFLKYTGTLDSACTITIGPNTVSKLWLIENATSGSQNIIIKQGSGATVTVPNGQTKAIYSDGAGSGGAMVDAFTGLSVPSLFVSGDLDVDGTTNLDVVDIDGAVDMASTLQVTGNLTLGADVIASDFDVDASGDINLDAGGGDWRLKDDGTTIATISNVSGDLQFLLGQDQDYKFQIDDSGTGQATALLLDGSESGAATFNSSVTIPTIAYVGTSIVHQGDANTSLDFGTDTQTFYAGGTRTLDLASGSVVINEGGADADFRVEAVGNANMLVVDAGSAHVNIGTATDYDAVLNVLSTDNGKTLSLVSTDTDANAGPVLALTRQSSSSAADGDVLGRVDFEGLNDANQQVAYGRMQTFIRDASDGTEDGTVQINHIIAGTERVALELDNDEYVFNNAGIDIDFRVESTGNANMLYVDAGSNFVGINTSSPNAPLHVQMSHTSTTVADASSNMTLNLANSGVGNGVYNAIKFSGNQQDMYLMSFNNSTQADRRLGFFVGSTAGDAATDERLSINGNGSVGIGTTDGDVTNDGTAARTYVGIIGTANRGRLNIGTTASNGADAGTLAFTNGTNSLVELVVDTHSGVQNAGDFTLDVTGDITFDADGGDFNFKDGGTTLLSLSNAGSNNVQFLTGISDGDLLFKGVDGGSVVTALTLDMSDGGTAIFGSWQKMADNNRIVFGAGSDLSIYSDGTDGKVLVSGNLDFDVSGNIKLDADDAGEIRFLDGGTQYATIKKDGNSALFQSIVADGDFLIQGIDGSSFVTAASFDMSEGGAATFRGNMTMNGIAGTSPILKLVNNDTEDVNTGRESSVRFSGFRSGGEAVDNAQISGNHTSSADDDKGGLFFYTNSGSGLGERMRITDSEIIINEDHNDQNFRVESDGNSTMLFVDGGDNRVGIGTSTFTAVSSTCNAMHVAGGSSDAVTPVMMISDADGSVEGNSTILECLFSGDNTFSSAMYVKFTDSGGTQGSISGTGDGTVTYNTSSDERLKQSIQDTDSKWDLVKSLQVRDYEWKKSGKQETGFIAQELHDKWAQPVKVGGEDVEVDPWSVDYGKLTPILTKALQEAMEKIEHLESEIAKLKGE